MNVTVPTKDLASAPPAHRANARDQAFETALAKAIEGETRFDTFTRGRYATDASIYQIIPKGVAFPKTDADIAAALQVAAEHGVPVIARGGGTSQNGQPIGSGLILDMSRHFNGITDYDPEARRVRVNPGTVLNTLNDRLRKDGLFFPVEPSTASRCTLGGMVGNNSSGARSLRFGKTVDNVLAIDGLFHDGEAFSLSQTPCSAMSPRMGAMMGRLTGLAQNHRHEIETIFPKVQRRVGGYNLDELLPDHPNYARLLVGSEGTLALTTGITLQLSTLPKHRVMGVCHFPDFRAAMVTTQHLVALGPVAVELVDNNVLVLGADIPLFVKTLGDITRGTPNCLLLVEFAGDNLDALKKDLKRLDQCMADLGFPNAVVEVIEPARQKPVWDVREACLNIMMSMKGDGKPVSFIEDCAVPLEHLADYTDAVSAVFAKYNTRGTWYAHASVGCLHVRPILNMKTEEGVRQMRAIADETSELVKKYKGSYSGEHGDGISRSDYIEPLFGSKLTRAFEAVKDEFDPQNQLNPGKIVRGLHMDDRSLMRFKPDYKVTALAEKTALDWSEQGSFGAAVEMCNNNGTCRKLSGGTMCPSYRATKDEQHLTRGRANSLRLAISGQLGKDAFTSPAMKETMDLCVSCKGCKLDCPTGVDMARMKIEFLHAYYGKNGLPLRERLIANLPKYARYASWLAPILNLRDRIKPLAALSEKMLGFSAQRSLPKWRAGWKESGIIAKPEDVVGDGRDLVLFGDTFNRWFERENLEAAERVLKAAGYRLHRVQPKDSSRAMCCGRTYLSAGQTDQARAESKRTLDTLRPFVERGARVVGLEPSCIMSFRDEMLALLPKDQTSFIQGKALLFEEALAADLKAGLVRLELPDQGGKRAHVHGHCHQKAFEAMGPVQEVLSAVPGLEVTMIESSCCGMSGAFGYAAENIEVSKKMAELSLLPAVRAAASADVIVADGTSCRHQIQDGTAREAIHVARLLDEALNTK